MDAGVRVQAAAGRNAVANKLPEQPAGTLQLIISPARYGSDLLSRYSAKLKPRFPSAWVMMNPQDAEERGLQEGDRVILDTDVGSFSLPLICHPQLAAGCTLVENSSALSSLVPGAGISYCEIGREVSHE